MKITVDTINNAFKHILKDLKSIDIKDYRKLIKTSYFSCYDLYGNFIGLSPQPSGLINIKMSNMGKFKSDIQREVYLERDLFLLDYERALKNNLKK